jgi:hypothetical protein
MALISKKNSTLKKVDIDNQRSIAVGFRKVVFYHEAAAGETSIALTDLNMPTTLSGVGYTNPSTSSLLALNLTFYRDNLLLISSARGVLQAGLSYIISGSTINFTTDFGDTLEGEIFTGILDPVAKTGAHIIDAAPLISTGQLAAGTVDYVVGQPFEANKYPSTQIGAVMVYVDGILQFRNVGNATADPGADGNYEEVAVAGGLSTLIRFNDEDPVNDRNIVVVSTNLIAERPTDSMMAVIERLQGQIDSLVEYCAVGFGVEETVFQVAPNNVDLKQFGDRVLELEEEATSSDLGLVTKNRWQQKFLAANKTTDQSPLTDLTFSNLTIGNVYRATFNGYGVITGTSSLEGLDVNITHNGSTIGFWGVRSDAGVADTKGSSHSLSVIFTATATSLTFILDVNGTVSLIGNGAASATNAILEELNNYETATTAWT